ncbi:MAG: ABC transporter related protein, ATP-binding cassette, subfamily B, bacterial [Candidatus Wolfebacteria bacterium GW2011_GWC1_43_10]|uniref:ABC transporter related protein, ATP-binding cassette, subfamily B, bacterial n=1 Tax=Candidatus Wolfebacteria bacterium GW2011_GWC1_43_10 TaxID=1619011 RepID=A0A0G1CBZ2_9BACT|nr:MAG: ABC transporter related protein, ATP-binding cassette, subfamily B, bacterial [Candidatus Wolfebacteria bacterium GW2011_GWC1_43_10]
MAKIKNRFSKKIFWEGVSILFRELKPHKKTVWFLVILSTLGAVFEAFVPLMAGKIFDAIIKIVENPLLSLVSIFGIIIVWFGLKFLSDVLHWKIGLSNQKLGVVLEAEYTAKGFGRLFELPIALHKEKKHGEIGDRIMRAAGRLEEIVTRVSVNLLPSFLSIVVALAITLLINWQLTAILLVAILLYVVVLWRSVPPLAGIQSKMHKAYNRAFGKAWDSLDNIQEIKQAATEDYEQNRIRESFLKKAAPLWVRMMDIYMKLDFVQRILISLCQLSIFVLSVFFVRDGLITPGQLVAFNGYAAMIFGPFVILGQNWQVVQNGFIALTRAERIIELPAEEYIPEQSTPFKEIGGDIVFKNVSFSYKTSENYILKDVSFGVKPGERMAIVGESGVGKTTLINLLLGLYFPQKGKIFVDGKDIRKIDLKSYRSRVGVVSQEPTLFNDTIGRNISYGSFGKSGKEIVRAVNRAHADEFIDKFPKKYKQLVGWKGIKLSIGQKQRIALARAFLKDPDILILDEPTSALDAKSEQLIKESLEELMKGRTTFIIAHRLSTIREADKILVFDKGRLVEQGKHDELMGIKNGVYREFYELQNKTS